jgi:hypothetical protein
VVEIWREVTQVAVTILELEQKATETRKSGYPGVRVVLGAMIPVICGGRRAFVKTFGDEKADRPLHAYIFDNLDDAEGRWVPLSELDFPPGAGS